MIIIRNGYVHDGHGDVRIADVALRDNTVLAIGENLTYADALEIEARERHIFPGFINALSYWGIFGPAWTGHDHSELSDPVTPHMDVRYAFDHDGMNFQRVYTYGVTAAGVAPQPFNVLAGQMGVYKTHGRSPQKMQVAGNTAMIASVTSGVKKVYGARTVTPMTKMGIFSLLIQELTKTSKATESEIAENPKLKALVPVLAGTMPLFVNCAGTAEIDAVFLALAPFPAIRLVLTGAYGLTQDQLQHAGRDVDVILGDQTEAFIKAVHGCDPTEVLPLFATANPPAIACTGDNTTAGKESLLWNAIWWRKRGLSSEQCLQAITTTPARLLGVADKLGALQPGLEADLSIWTKNPFDTYEAKLEKVFVSGEDVLATGGYRSCW